MIKEGKNIPSKLNASSKLNNLAKVSEILGRSIYFDVHLFAVNLSLLLDLNHVQFLLPFFVPQFRAVLQ